MLQGVSAATAAVAFGQLAGCTSSDDPDALPPNVLLVLADDMRADFLRFAEQTRMRLGAAGCTYSAARTNVSLCQPFRVGLLTGQWSQRHMMLGNGDTSRVPHDDTIGRWVQDAGYRTALIGKYLNGAPAQTPAPTGWTTWRQVLGDSDTESYDRLGYSVHDGTTTTQPPAPQTAYLRDEVIEFVAGPEPWFCMMTPTSPHYPFEPEPEDVAAWADLEWETPEDPDVASKPSWYSSLPPLPAEAKAALRATARGQAGEISGLDRAVVGILDSLPSAVLANTVVIFSSDSGLTYGEHRSPYGGASKNDFYDHNLLVPLVCSGPGFTSGASADPVSPEVDIAKTIIAITGATALLPGDGLDLRDIQADPDAHAARHLLHERAGGGDNNPTPVSGLCVSTRTRKLMRWTGQRGTDRYEAYDLDTDPNEFANWALDPARLTERQALEAELDRLSPPPPLVPNLLYGSGGTNTSNPTVTASISPAYRSVLIVDVFGTLDGAEVADVTLAGDCIDRVVLRASNSQSDPSGRIHRRLMSFQARGTGSSGPITVTPDAGQALISVGLTVTEYAYRSAVVQTVATGAATSATTFGATLTNRQTPGTATHLSILTDADVAMTATGGATLLHEAGSDDPSVGFATLWVAANDGPSATTRTAATRWSVVASEIGT